MNVDRINQRNEIKSYLENARFRGKGTVLTAALNTTPAAA
jgi:hypothetical protein